MPGWIDGGEDQVDSTDDRRTVNNTVRHQYRTLTDNEKVDMRAIKDAGADLLAHIETVASHTPDGRMTRELALARTKTEEAVMWAVKHITR